MVFHDFLGEVARNAAMGSPEQALRATNVVLETLGERLHPPQANQLSATLPEELARILLEKGRVPAEEFPAAEFVRRVSARGAVDLPDAVRYCQAVIRVLAEAAVQQPLVQISRQLPRSYQELFAIPEHPASVSGAGRQSAV